MNKRDFIKREIYVEYSFGANAEEKKQFHLFVDPDESLRSGAKQPLAEYLRIPLEEIQIYTRGAKKEFDDSKSLRYYGLQGGGFFHMTRHEPTSRVGTKRANNNERPGAVHLERRPSYSDIAKKAIGIPPQATKDRVEATRRRSSLLEAEKLRHQHSAAKAAEEERLRRQRQQEEQEAAKRRAEEVAARQQREEEAKACAKISITINDKPSGRQYKLRRDAWQRCS